MVGCKRYQGLFQVFLIGIFLIVSSQAGADGVYREPLRISLQSGKVYEFQVEIADTAQKRQLGLMFRKNLAPFHGMLFDYKSSRPVAMWMKNTFIPLDMLFIKADGTIETIHERTIPHKLDSLASRGKVRAVLEVAGGTAERLDIQVGDRVLHAIFEQR